jgi:hypothetical protein
MAGRALVLFVLAAWIPANAVLLGCGSERETGDRATDAEIAGAADPFSGSYRVKGLTTDETRGDSRRIEGIIVLTAQGETYSTKAEFETKYPSAGGPVDAQVIGTGVGERSGAELAGTAETQLVMSTVPGIDTGFAWVPRDVGPRLVSTWKAHFRRDGTLVVHIENEGAQGEEYFPTTTVLYGTRIEESSPGE